MSTIVNKPTRDLSKAFDYMSHGLIIAKLNTLKLIQSYLTESTRRTKINQTYNSWEELLFGVPQGYIVCQT